MDYKIKQICLQQAYAQNLQINSFCVCICKTLRVLYSGRGCSHFFLAKFIFLNLIKIGLICLINAFAKIALIYNVTYSLSVAFYDCPLCILFYYLKLLFSVSIYLGWNGWWILNLWCILIDKSSSTSTLLIRSLKYPTLIYWLTHL